MGRGRPAGFNKRFCPNFQNEPTLADPGGGGALETCVCASPDPNTFIFMQFLAKFCEIIGQRPASGVGAPCEILDPPPEGAPRSTTGWYYFLVVQIRMLQLLEIVGSVRGLKSPVWFENCFTLKIK